MTVHSKAADVIFRRRQYNTESLTPDWYCGCSLGDGKYAKCTQNNRLTEYFCRAMQQSWIILEMYVCMCVVSVRVCKGGLWQAVSVTLGWLYVYLGAELCICDVCVCVCKGMV